MARRNTASVSPAAASDALRSPLYGAVAPWLARLPADRFPSRDELNSLASPGMSTGGGQPLRFAPPGPPGKAFESLYEVRTFRKGEVATREENWHDLFNALAWLAFPQAKAVINRRHYETLNQRGAVSGPRGTARDLLTLFDEGGVIATCSAPVLGELLRGFRWKELFWERRAEVAAHMRFFVLGHAILEKALEPYKSLTAKALMLDVLPEFAGLDARAQLAIVDEGAARWLAGSDALRSTRALPPLPVLGVPGWSERQDAAFYDDPEVFRPGYRALGNRIAD